MRSQDKPPWGLGATAAFSVLISLLFVFGQTLAAFAYLWVQYLKDSSLDFGAAAAAMRHDGMFLVAGTLTAAPLALIAIFVFARLRAGWTARGYLGLTVPRPGVFLTWIGAALLCVVTSDAITYLFGRPVVPPFVRGAFSTALYPPLLYFAVVIVAPVQEELFFRGFVFRGLEATRLGGGGAALATAILFALPHVQYDLYGIATAFALGLVLGAARWRTGSTTVALSMHMLINLVASLEAVLF